MERRERGKRKRTTGKHESKKKRNVECACKIGFQFKGGEQNEERNGRNARNARNEQNERNEMEGRERQKRE